MSRSNPTAIGVGPIHLIQQERRKWIDHNFPGADDTPIEPFLGVTEEVGELSHSILKRMQGIRGSEEKHLDDMWDAIGDVMIYMMGVCDSMGWDLEAITQDVWKETVVKRDWKANPEDGS